jgi:hypothetical protein
MEKNNDVIAVSDGAYIWCNPVPNSERHSFWYVADTDTADPNKVFNSFSPFCRSACFNLPSCF